MKSTFRVQVIALLAVIGFSMAACSDGSGNDSIPTALQGGWAYNEKTLFTINANGTGTIEGQDGYTVQITNGGENFKTGNVIFKKGGAETGQFTYSLNGDGDMWIQSGTGPFAKWVNLGSDGKGRNWTINNLKTIRWEKDKDGWIQFSTNDPQYYYWSFYITYDNSQANSWEIVCKKMSGADNYGSGMFFAAADNTHYYRFLITPYGEYNVWKLNGEEWTKIFDWAKSTKINSGYNKENTLKVTNSGYTYTLFINGEQVNQFTDIAPFGNKIGLIACTGKKADENFPYTPVDVRFKIK